MAQHRPPEYLLLLAGLLEEFDDCAAWHGQRDSVDSGLEHYQPDYVALGVEERRPAGPRVDSGVGLNEDLSSGHASRVADDTGIDTKARVAEMLGDSRARVTQCTNLLKLPSTLLQFLLDHDDDPVVRNYFSERRLRPLTFITDAEEVVERFRSMLEHARSAPGAWTDNKEGDGSKSQRVG